MIVLYAPMIMTGSTTILIADGGGGGGGGGGTGAPFHGAGGKDPLVVSPVVPAAGGLGGDQAGDGGAGFAATGNIPDAKGGNPGEGGGGGGGGAGCIRSNQSLGTATVSPSALGLP